MEWAHKSCHFPQQVFHNSQGLTWRFRKMAVTVQMALRQLPLLKTRLLAGSLGCCGFSLGGGSGLSAVFYLQAVGAALVIN
jgi:hypothetical protein